MQRWVFHIDMDSFFASCEQLTRPTLRDRPVLVGGVSGRGVVAGASYQARALGCHSAMPMFQAKPLIGYRGVVVSPRKSLYTAVSRRVFEVVARVAGVIEQISIDEAYLDPEEMRTASAEEAVTWAEELRRLIREETGLTASIGIGPGKQYAKIGSGQAKPDGVFILPPEHLQEILDPLPVSVLWGIGKVTSAKLKMLGVDTIGQFAAMSQEEVSRELGDTVGRTLWKIARGYDPRPVQPRAEAKQISSEHTYPKDLSTASDVDAAIARAASEAYSRLREDGRGARTVTVKLRMATFRVESRSTSLPYATDDAAVLSATAAQLARYPEELGPIRLVGVSYSGLEAERQGILFPELDQGQPVSHAVTPSRENALQMSWKPTQDVYHPDFGHGWIQGVGRGVMTVRFETRSTGPGFIHSFSVEDPALVPADPLCSLDWDDWLETYSR